MFDTFPHQTVVSQTRQEVCIHPCASSLLLPPPSLSLPPLSAPPPPSFDTSLAVIHCYSVTLCCFVFFPQTTLTVQCSRVSRSQCSSRVPVCFPTARTSVHQRSISSCFSQHISICLQGEKIFAEVFSVALIVN